MAALSIQSVAAAGLTPSYSVAAAGGDTFVNDGKTFLHVKNANVGATRTVTINSRVACNQGYDHDYAVVVPASGEKMIGTFDTTRFNDSSGSASITYSSEADVTIAALKI